MWHNRILIAFIAFIIISCSDRKAEVTIDNPTGSKIVLQFEGEEHIIDSLSQKIIYFKVGKNEITYNDSTITYDLTEFDNDYNKPDFLLNPTASTYILEQINYTNRSPNGNIDLYKDKIPYDTIRVMNAFDISGNYLKTNDFIIREKWDYGINENIPRKLQIKDVNKNVYRVKIYREADFIDKLMEQK